MSIIEEKFEHYKQEKGDIEEHMYTLYTLANECDSVVELGTRKLVSTWAFLLAKPKFLTCVDIVHPYSYGDEGRENFDLAIRCAKEEFINFEFIYDDDLNIEIPECDLLFIDTEHTYDQVTSELNLHASKVKKYIIFHDTIIMEVYQAICEFLFCHNEWGTYLEFTNNNGLIVLRKK